MKANRDSSVSIVIRLRAGRKRNGSLKPGRGSNIVTHPLRQGWLWITTSLPFNVQWCFILWFTVGRNCIWTLMRVLCSCYACK